MDINSFAIDYQLSAINFDVTLESTMSGIILKHVYLKYPILNTELCSDVPENTKQV